MLRDPAQAEETGLVVMKLPRTLPLLAALLVSTGQAVGQDSYHGDYDLEGRYSTRRKTEARLQIRNGTVYPTEVTRTARYTGQSFQGTPEFTWTSSDVRRSANGRVLRVIYRLGPGEAQLDGIVSRLDPDRDTRREVLAAIGLRYKFVAVYFFSTDFQTVREFVSNTTRVGSERWWHWVETRGTKITQAPIQPVSSAEFLRRAREHIRSWYLGHIREKDGEILAEMEEELAEIIADGDQAYANLYSQDVDAFRQDMQRDLDFDQAVTLGDTLCEHFEDCIDERVNQDYYHGGPYEDALGRPIPRLALEVISIRFEPTYAGVELLKPFVFDTRTGACIRDLEIEDAADYQ
jgi:hypothetical protein